MLGTRSYLVAGACRCGLELGSHRSDTAGNAFLRPRHSDIPVFMVAMASRGLVRSSPHVGGGAQSNWPLSTGRFRQRCRTHLNRGATRWARRHSKLIASAVELISAYANSRRSRGDPDRHRCGFGVSCDHALPGPNRQAVVRQTFPRSGLFRQGSGECWERAARSVLVVSRARHARGVRGAARREADFGSTPWRLAQCLRWWRVACIDAVAG